MFCEKKCQIEVMELELMFKKIREIEVIFCFARFFKKIRQI